MTRYLFIAALLTSVLAAEGPVTIDLLPPAPNNPRNTEGAFVKLKDGRLLLIYSRFTSDGAADSGAASLAARYSSDGGRTWTRQDEIVVENEGAMNTMSVSLIRLKSGGIALFYVRKNSMLDCRPYMRVSRNEGKTWSAPVLAISEPGYYVLNNDRAHQTRSGRIILPVALHRNESADPAKFNSRGIAMCYLSDDRGKTWRRSKTVLENPAPHPAGLQEPGIVALKDGRLLMYLRTGMGSQYFSYSTDHGETWTPTEPSGLQSPLSPATIKRIPKTGDLLAVWNDHSNVAADIKNRLRTPLTAAISRDEGRTWEKRRDIAADPEGWYCYTAMEFVGDRVVLAYNAGGSGLARLSRTVVTYFDLDWLYR
jgi:Neuraminidase (sialidase)